MRPPASRASGSLAAGSGGPGCVLIHEVFQECVRAPCSCSSVSLLSPLFPFSHPRFDRQAPEKSLKGRYGSLGSGDFDPNMFPGGLGGMGGMMGTRGSLQGDVHQAMMQVATFFVCLPAVHPPPSRFAPLAAKTSRRIFATQRPQAKMKPPFFAAGYRHSCGPASRYTRDESSFDAK